MILRSARPDDCQALAPLVYAAGPRLLDHCLGLRGRAALDYLRFAVARPEGIFGAEVTRVGELDGEVVLCMTAYPGRRYGALSRATLRSAVAFYGLLALPGLIARLLPLASLFEDPSPRGMFVANCCVASAQRGRGLFHQAMQACIEDASDAGLECLQLDVSDDNPKAEATYRRYGFVETGYRPYSGRADLPGFRRLQLALPRG